MRLDGQTAIITGSSRGLGREMAIRFSEEGCRVVIHGTSAKAAEETASLCDGETEVVLGDIRDAETSSELVEAALGRFGRLDILVNNAGNARLEAFLDFDYSHFQDMLSKHVDGTFLASQHVARAMARLGGGRILNMSSVAAACGQFGFAAYGTAKAAIEGLTRVLAVELAQYRINVNCLSPGPVLTDMLAGIYTAEQLTDRARTIPAQRLASPHDVAETALFLVSPEAAYITGQVLRLDGGATAAGCFTMEVFKRSPR
jgi:3-oxoacyl-[acyl-carrier protein] reductase